MSKKSNRNNATKAVNTDRKIVSKDVSADVIQTRAKKLAKEMKVSWVNPKVKAILDAEFPQLVVKKEARTTETKRYVRRDSVGRAWESRKKLFGPSGYVNGKHPKGGTGKEKVVLSDEEKAARKKAAAQASWKSRKELYGDSGYKAGHSPLTNGEKKKADIG